MKESSEIIYNLVLEKRVGDYALIDCNRLDICNKNVSNTLESIDAFTCSYQLDEIKESIKRCNTVTPDYLYGELKVISNFKHNLKVLSKIDFDNVREFQSFLYVDSELKSKLYCSFKNCVDKSFSDRDFKKKLLESFNNSIKICNMYNIFDLIQKLPYIKSRMIYFTISNYMETKKKENNKKLEKLNDVI